MNQLEQFETQLQRCLPARPSEDFMARLIAAEPAPHVQREVPTGKPMGLHDLLRLWRWLVPATVVVVAGLVVWRLILVPSSSHPHTGGAVLAGSLKADDVQIVEQLVSSFDAVAKLPTGEPVRFRCQKWVDEVVLSDRKRGVVIEQRTPRVEVVPVGFETY